MSLALPMNLWRRVYVALDGWITLVDTKCLCDDEKYDNHRYSQLQDFHRAYLTSSYFPPGHLAAFSLAIV